jgi:predicted ATPase/class 3 adenylate cyclase
VDAAGRPPEGTIALLFTDIEGSTRLATALGTGWADVLAAHHAIVTDAIAAERGYIDGTEGDAFFATFTDAAAGARAAVAALRALREFAWPAEVGELKVRMGLHVGYVERSDTGYVGLEVHRAARVASAAHGGQLLMSATARGLAGTAIETESVGVHRLKDFPAPEQLYCAVIDGRGAAAFPPPRAAEARPTNLPAGLPTLVGRDHDLERVRDAFLNDGDRLVTLTGRGGAGKTSLALVAAASLLEADPGGVWLSRLATVPDTDEAIRTIAASVGAEQDVDRAPMEVLANRLRHRGPTLLVLDNMEHVLAAAPALAELLEALPEVRLLLSSQTPLRLATERVLTLDSLDDESALALIERVARRRSSAFSVGRDGRAELLEVIHLLDGLPLALELAGARLALLTPAQLADRLRASPDVLRDDRADRPARHRSLRATVEWTLGLLEAPARALFVRLGAFAGPVELEEMEAVAGTDGLDVLGELATLVDVALVRRVESGDGRIRFGLPEALRQIAAAMLDAAPDGESWHRAHAVRQHQIAYTARVLLLPTAVHQAAERADPEMAAAIRWARRTGDPLASSLCTYRGALLSENGHLREAFAMLEPVIADPPDDPDVLAHALWAYSWALTAIGRLDEAFAPADRAVELAVGPANRAQALVMRSLAETFAGKHLEGLADVTEAAEIARGVDAAVLCGVLMIKAQAHLFAGELDVVAGIVDEAERVGAPVDANFRWRRHTVAGDLAVRAGRPREALEHYARSIEEAEIRGNQLQVLFDLIGGAVALVGIGSDAEAVELAAIADQLVSEMGGPEAVGVHLLGADEVTEAAERLGPDVTAEVRARGRAVPAAARGARACQLARAPAVTSS